LAVTANLAGESIARPPDTLDFGIDKFAKIHESLFNEPVRHVMICDAESKPYPYALIFEAKIIFLNAAGEKISESIFPTATRIKTGESTSSKYLTLYANLGSSNSGFVRLYERTGELLLALDDISYNDRIGAPFPLEKSRKVVWVGDGTLVLTNFKGDTLVTRPLLNPDSFQDGQIVFALNGNNDQFMAVANKYQIPSGAESDWPVLYHFDPKLNIISQVQLPYILVSEIRCAPDNDHFIVRAELESGQNKFMLSAINSGPTERPFAIDGSSIISIAQMASMLLQTPKQGTPRTRRDPRWNESEAIQINTPRFPWIDATVSPDGKYALFYNDDILALYEFNRKSLSQIPFPYSFSRCFISRGGKRIILAGQFGFEVYKSTK
jgi:hypothetical protein